jgi:hypothetical protein
MLPLQFFSQNVHFGVNLFAALVFFAVFWLYFDAWTDERKIKVLVRSLGFLLVALSYLAQSTVIEQSVLGSASLNNVIENIAAVLCILGFMGIIISRVIDPLQKKPELAGINAAEFESKKPTTQKLPLFGAMGLTNPLHWLPPVGALTITVLYWRRATKGLERHLKLVAVAFGFIFISELLSLASLWQSTTNPNVSRLVAAFGPVWIAQLVFLLAGAVVLGRWVWRYLTKRFMSQLFMTFIGATLAGFLIIAVSFTSLLVNNVQKSSLNNLDTAANVLSYAINSKQSESLSDLQTVAENPLVVNAVIASDHNSLVNLTNDYLHNEQQSSLTITNAVGEVLIRAQDPNRWGDSISSDTNIRRALIGQSVSSIDTQAGVLAPSVNILSVVPIFNTTNNQIVGAVEGGLVLDSAFVSGIKQATGLDSSIYAADVVSATTFLAPDGVTHLVGATETDNAVRQIVLAHGQTFKGVLNIQNRQYLAVFTPLKDINNNVVGMLFIGQPQVATLQTAGHAVELTFVIAVLLIIFSVFPAYILSKYIAKQLD